MAYTGAGGRVLTPGSANAAPADRKTYGSFKIIEAESLEAAQKIIENDSYYTAGVVSVLLFWCKLGLNCGTTSGTRRRHWSFRSC